MIQQGHKVVPMDGSGSNHSEANIKMGTELAAVAESLKHNSGSSSKGKKVYEESSSKNRTSSLKFNFDFDLMVELRHLYEACTYENAKLAMIWFLDTASIKFSMSVSILICNIYSHTIY